MKVEINTIEELPAVAERILREYPDERFFALFGSMGVGKTTLIKEICSQIGVSQNVCSPTFAIVNEYSDGNGEPVYHFDFYRVDNIAEAYDIGYEEYFYSGNWCFTEWTEKIEPLLPDHHVRIDITEHDGHRTLVAKMSD